MITVDFSRLSIQPGDRILDVGCGSGRHTCEAYRWEGAVAIGSDISFDDVWDAAGRLMYHDDLNEHGGGSWGVSVSNISCLPFRDDSFDHVVCSEVLEHIPDDATAISEIVRVLKPGRTLVVSVPRYLPERICWALSDDYYNANQGHVRIYKKKELIRAIEKAGVVYTCSHFAHSIHSPYWWLKCLVGPTREDVWSVNLYKRFLTWDIMKKPRVTRFVDWLFNPLLGKSVVVYFTKS